MKIQNVILSCLGFMNCDLIGFNRLGNNIDFHDHARNRNKFKYGFIGNAQQRKIQKNFLDFLRRSGNQQNQFYYMY